MDANGIQKPVQTLLEELVSTLALRAWVDESDLRHELKAEIVRRVKQGDVSPQPILNLLQHADWAVRENAAEMLGWIGGEEVVQPLVDHLWRDRSVAVRGTIALALERIATPAALSTAREFSQVVRAYPEVVGRVADWAEHQGLDIHDVFGIRLDPSIKGICLEDTREIGQGKCLSFDLCDLLAVIGLPARVARWCCRDVECTGNYASEMHAIADQGLIVSGGTLAYMALMLDQTIDGVFVAIREDDEIWLEIRAVDSTWFEVWSGDTQVLEAVRGHFRQVSDIQPG